MLKVRVGLGSHCAALVKALVGFYNSVTYDQKQDQSAATAHRDFAGCAT